MNFHLEHPLQSSSVSVLFASESDHMPSQEPVQSPGNVTVRGETVALIQQVQFVSDFDSSLVYLAINYLDRYISRQQIPLGKPWIYRLLAISCVSLAAKMNKLDFSLVELQGDEGFIFDSSTIRRMEMTILNALNWRMRSITPFAFVQYFISSFLLTDPPLRQALKERATEILYKSHNCSYNMKLLVFKPSIIAASALLSASHELFPLQCPAFKSEISSSYYICEENLLQCCEVMEEILIDGYESLFDKMSGSETPDNILDQYFSSDVNIDSDDSDAGNNNSQSVNKRQKIGQFGRDKDDEDSTFPYHHRSLST